MTKRWTDKEKQDFYDILKKNSVKEACTLYAKKSGRTYVAVYSWYARAKKSGRIPKSVLNAIPKSLTLWTKDEIKDLLQLIAEHPNNFSEAYRIHAENTGRTFDAVEQYFMQYRKKEEAKTCMVTVEGKKRNSPNRKNIHSKTGGTAEPIKQSKWKQILNILFG